MEVENIKFIRSQCEEKNHPQYLHKNIHKTSCNLMKMDDLIILIQFNVIHQLEQLRTNDCDNVGFQFHFPRY